MIEKKNEWVDFREIKEKVSIEDILNHYEIIGDLERKNDELVGPCPFHDDGGYSQSCFHANTVKNIFHCFFCQAGGNIFDFVSAAEDISIRGAACLIQKWFGIVPQEARAVRGKIKARIKKDEQENEQKSTKAGRNTERVKRGEEPNQPLTFELKNLDQKHAYLKERNLKEETIKQFGLGYCSRGLMKGWIVIPIHNEKEELVAYAGRYPGEPRKEEPRYKLPPKFQKHLVLYNLNRAGKEAKEKRLILVEGFFDTFRLWQAGYKNVVALMGTLMSDKQEQLIMKAVGENGKVTLMFDNDEAGGRATTAVVERLINKVYIKVINLKEEQTQPDQLKEEDIKSILG